MTSRRERNGFEKKNKAIDTASEIVKIGGRDLDKTDRENLYLPTVCEIKLDLPVSMQSYLEMSCRNGS